MEYAVELHGCVHVTPDDGGECPVDAPVVEALLDLVMEELLGLDASDPSIELDLTGDLVTLSLVVEAGDPVEAVSTARGVLRRAIQAAGGGTPDCSGVDDRAWGITLVALRSSLVRHDDDLTLLGASIR